MKRISLVATLVAAAAALVARPALAESPRPTTAPTYSAAELDRLVKPIALYPDPLLAQVLAAATYSSEIPDAARWADAHQTYAGSALSGAMGADGVRWDPAVQALLPFPSVLDMMAADLTWTDELGNAVLTERAAVMDAVQRMRHDAWSYGYLRSNTGVTVTSGPCIEILPVDSAYIPVPYYDPLIVFAPPRPGFFVGGAIRFGHGVRLGVPFEPWGWGATRLVWPRHQVIINRVPWERTWTNRNYVHPYGIRGFAHQSDRHPAAEHRVARRDRDRHR